MALPLVHAARHNDVKPLLGRELMILTHDDDDDDVCMYACMYVSPSAPPELVTMNGHGWDGIQCPLLASEKTLKRVEYNCIGGGGSYKGGAVPPTDLRGIAQ